MTPRTSLPFYLRGTPVSRLPRLSPSPGHKAQPTSKATGRHHLKGTSAEKRDHAHRDTADTPPGRLKCPVLYRHSPVCPHESPTRKEWPALPSEGGLPRARPAQGQAGGSSAQKSILLQGGLSLPRSSLACRLLLYCCMNLPFEESIHRRKGKNDGT